MFDTHCHLNFQTFDGRVEKVVEDAKKAGVTHIVIPGTDVESSRNAVKIAQKFPNVYAAVGIHPHHIYQFQISPLRSSSFEGQANFKFQIEDELKEIENLLVHPKVVAVGEVGVDRYYYRQTKYESYQVDEQFISLQKEVLEKQIKLAIRHNKSLILHNREAKRDLLEVLGRWKGGKVEKLRGRTVFHCCEPYEELLEYAFKHDIFIGVDGDVTYSQEKQGFVKKIPLDHLVLETDSPFLTPEPLRSKQKSPSNVPANISLIASAIANLKQISEEDLKQQITQNARRLFRV